MNRALAAIFFAAVFLTFLTPMELGGFWWHLSTGQWILDHLRIPQEDPFSITAAQSSNASFVLKAFWLCQVVYAVIERLSGLWGIIALKAATFTLVFYTLIRFGRGSLLAYAVSLPAVFAATFYTESRPQTFSFLFFALTIMLMEKGRTAYRENSKPPRSFYMLPLLMLVWANTHPGYVIGDALICVYLIGALSSAAMGKSRHRAAGFVFVGALSLGLSALNPNGLEAVVHTFRMLETSVFGRPSIHEHLPLQEFTEFTGQRGLYTAIVSLIAVGFASFAIRWRRPDVLHLLVFAALSALSLKTFRAGFFFAIFAVAVAGRNLSELALPPALRSTAAKSLAAAAILAATLSVLVPRTIIARPVMAEGVIPDRAAAFIERESLPPNIYHPYEWGGYLMWRLYPEYKVFIDSRGIGPAEEHRAVLNGGPGWERILEKHGVNTVLFWPILPFRADVPPIVFELQRHSGWSPVYWDSKSVIYVRSGLARRKIAKSTVWKLLTAILHARIARNPQDPSNHASLGEVYLAMGLKSLAAEELRKALMLNPRDRKTALLLRSVEQP